MKSPVTSITDEQLAELEEAIDCCSHGGISHKVTSAGEVASLIARLRAAEADAKLARQRVKEIDLLFGRYLLGMKAAVIEMDHGLGSRVAMQWIIDGLDGPGELPPEDEYDAQAFFDREIKHINDAMTELLEASRNTMES